MSERQLVVHPRATLRPVRGGMAAWSPVERKFIELDADAVYVLTRFCSPATVATVAGEFEGGGEMLGELVAKLEALGIVVPPDRVQLPPTESAVSDIDRPVLLVGCARSGTSLVANIVDAHSHVATVMDAHFFMPLRMLLETPQSFFKALSLDPPAVARHIRRFASGVIGEYAAREGKRRWATKSPEYLWHMHYLWRVFPDAQVVHIVRHPFAVAQSMETMLTQWGLGDRVYEYVKRFDSVWIAAAEYWRDINQRFVEFARLYPEACYVFQYETLGENADLALQNLCGFLGEPYEPQMLDVCFSKDKREFAQDPKFDQFHRFERDRLHTWQDWPEVRRAMVWERVSEVAEAFGYRADTPVPAPMPLPLTAPRAVG